MKQELDIPIQYTIEKTSIPARKSTKKFDWWYMFILVIYMGMATPETSRMVQSLSGNPIPLLLPMVLTYMLYVKHRVKFNSPNLKLVVSIFLLWAIMSVIKWHTYTISEFSYYFFPFYNIIIAYVQVKAFGKELIPLYESVIVTFAKISLVFWMIYILHIPILDNLATLFPDTNAGNSIFYIYTWGDLSKIPTGKFASNAIRSAGCSWEAGRFAIMIVLGIFCNICRKGVRFSGNKNLIWLFAALATTLSTTGFVTTIGLYLITLIRKINTKTILTLIALIPVCYGIYSLDFVGNKITTKLEESQDVSRLIGQFAYNSQNHVEGQYLGSIDRFDAAVFEAINLYEDPLLGYSNNFDHSFFYREITTNYSLAHGLVKVFSMYGLIFGLIIYYWLFRSSIRIAEVFPLVSRYALVVTFMMSAISYRVFTIPVFTAFWLFGIFYDDYQKKVRGTSCPQPSKSEGTMSFQECGESVSINSSINSKEGKTDKMSVSINDI